jgi:hypothetical protein
MATAPRRMTADPDAPPVAPSPAAESVLPSIASESRAETFAREAAADRGLETPPISELSESAPESISESISAPMSGPDEWTHEHPSPDRIAAEAYAIYIANGQRDGNDLNDWLEAERRLRLRPDAGAVDG